MSSTFNSTAFFLSKLGQDQAPAKSMRQIELDIVEDPSTREVCQGNNCSLYYDSNSSEYVTSGNCSRQSLCTETRIMKDSLYIREGTISNTNRCINYSSQLKDWSKKLL